MRLRLLGLAVALVPVLAGASSGQCTYLGAPGFTGCAPGGGLPPILSCVGVPNISGLPCGNSFGAVSFGIQVSILVPPACCIFPGSVLLIGNCASPPFPAPVGPPLCPPSLVGGCVGYVDTTAFAALVTGFGPGGPLCITIPNDASLVGLTLCAQALLYCAIPGPCSNNCIQVSNGLSITILP